MPVAGSRACPWQRALHSTSPGLPKNSQVSRCDRRQATGDRRQATGDRRQAASIGRRRDSPSSAPVRPWALPCREVRCRAPSGCLHSRELVTSGWSVTKPRQSWPANVLRTPTFDGDIAERSQVGDGTARCGRGVFASLCAGHGRATGPGRCGRCGLVASAAVGTGTFGFDVSTGLRPLRPWVNVLTNAQLGALVSESRAGNTWALNIRLNQLMAWSKDAVTDPPSEWLLLQDRRTRQCWSLAPPAWGAGDVVYHVQHAQGTTTISHRRGALEVRVCWCVDPVSAVKQMHVEVRNLVTQRAHLRLVGMVEWMMGDKRTDRATRRTAACFEPPQGGRFQGLLCMQTEEAAGFGGGNAFLCEAPASVGARDSLEHSLDWTSDYQVFFLPGEHQGASGLPSWVKSVCSIPHRYVLSGHCTLVRYRNTAAPTGRCISPF